MSVENVDDSVWLSMSMTGGTHPDTAGTSDTGSRLHIHTHTCTVQQRVRQTNHNNKQTTSLSSIVCNHNNRLWTELIGNEQSIR